MLPSRIGSEEAEAAPGMDLDPGVSLLSEDSHPGTALGLGAFCRGEVHFLFEEALFMFGVGFGCFGVGGVVLCVFASEFTLSKMSWTHCSIQGKQ